jgi:hypothetical protein
MSQHLGAGRSPEPLRPPESRPLTAGCYHRDPPRRKARGSLNSIGGARVGVSPEGRRGALSPPGADGRLRRPRARTRAFPASATCHRRSVGRAGATPRIRTEDLRIRNASDAYPPGCLETPNSFPENEIASDSSTPSCPQEPPNLPDDGPQSGPQSLDALDAESARLSFGRSDLPPDLVCLADIWTELPEETRAAILTLARGVRRG